MLLEVRRPLAYVVLSTIPRHDEPRYLLAVDIERIGYVVPEDAEAVGVVGVPEDEAEHNEKRQHEQSSGQPIRPCVSVSLKSCQCTPSRRVAPYDAAEQASVKYLSPTLL